MYMYMYMYMYPHLNGETQIEPWGIIDVSFTTGHPVDNGR